MNILTGIHSVCHIDPGTRQKACGFVHQLLILAAVVFLRRLTQLLFRILSMSLIQHVRMSWETICTSHLWVWVAIAGGPHVYILLVIELVVIQHLIFIVLHALNNLWLKRMIIGLHHLWVLHILARLLREEILGKCFVFRDNAICSTCTVCLIYLKMIWSWTRPHVLAVSVRLLRVRKYILLITFTKMTASGFLLDVKALHLLLIHAHIIVCFLHLFIIFLL